MRGVPTLPVSERVSASLGRFSWWWKLDGWAVLRLPLFAFLLWQLGLGLYDGLSVWLLLGQRAVLWYFLLPLALPLTAVKAYPPLVGLYAGVSLSDGQPESFPLLVTAVGGVTVLVAGLWWLAPIIFRFVSLVLFLTT